MFPDEDNSSIDSSNDFDNDAGTGLVQLGYVEDENNSGIEKKNNCSRLKFPNWKKWDGGKAGGFPIWLVPSNIPISERLQCNICTKQMIFLLQIYSPIDDIPDAFHRMLYLFCCKNRDCVREESIRCFRAQLPRVNPFYPSYMEIESDPTSAHLPASIAPPAPLCPCCGCFASMICSACKTTRYCSRDHQKLHWKTHKTVCQFGSASAFSASSLPSWTPPVFPELSIEVADEQGEEDGDHDEDNQDESKKPLIWEDAVTPGGEDEEADARLTQQDYNRALQGDQAAAKHDPIYTAFLTRLQRAGQQDQILRYYRSQLPAADASQDEDYLRTGALLLLSGSKTVRDRRKRENLTACSRCGAARSFEMQVMPQLLHYLRVDKNTAVEKHNERDQISPVNRSSEDIDWGSIDIFTCTASCSTGLDFSSCRDAYVDELIMIQHPPT